jgi:hypothetical protein
MLSRSLLAAAMFAAPLFAFSSASPAHADTSVLTGSMESTADIDQSFIAFVPEGTASVTLSYPIDRTSDIFGTGTRLGSYHITSTPICTKSDSKPDSSGNTVVSKTWTKPAGGYLLIDVHINGADVKTDLHQPLPHSPFPLDAPPLDICDYLEPSPKAQSNQSVIGTTTAGLIYTCHSEADAANAIARWVADNIKVERSRRTYTNDDALSTFQYGAGSSTGIANLFVAMARSIGIPARYVGGFTTAGSLNTFDFSTAASAWAELWFPTVGWVAYEPLATDGFADSHHIRIFVGADSSSAGKTISGAAATGAPFQYSNHVEATATDVSMLVQTLRVEKGGTALLLARDYAPEPPSK